MALLDEVPTGDHMEFDPELVIQLHWAGVPVRNVTTRVVYNPGGLSHFDTVRDNARLTSVYTRATFGMLRRLPARARRLALSLRIWKWVHVPISLLLCFLVLLHVWVVLYY